MTNATALEESGVKMTIRVYTVDCQGTVTEDRGTVTITGGREPLPVSFADPPCACPLHRGGGETPR